MQTVILAAGEGTRMRPLSATRPKPLLPVAGKPLMAHTLEAAAAAGASEFIIVVGYRDEAIRDAFGDSLNGIPITYVDQPTQAGTADALLAARPHLAEAPFVVLAGDNLYDPASLTDLYAGGPAVGTFEVANPANYGVFDIEGDTVIDVVEKPADPPSNLVNVSAYVFTAAAQQWLDGVEPSTRGEYELTDVLARQIRETDVQPVSFQEWIDVGRPWELLAANEWKLAELERRIEGRVDQAAELIGDVVVEPGARVRHGVTIEGPVLIEEGATVGPNAYVRGATMIGAGASVGHAVEVKNSVLHAEATVSHLSYVGDSLLGEAVNFGAGTTVANLRHDDEPVRVTVKGERVSTGRRKFGVVAGDQVKTGINTSLNAGVVLTTGSTTKPGEVVTRDR